ncbi:type II toxin-antitoxin system RelE/ParE family toxin [Nostoc sp. B(2019)]|nr:type II toxin-antitoxin system RelE/ParE family toxin [Nostoc sp. B(2019)]
MTHTLDKIPKRSNESALRPDGVKKLKNRDKGYRIRVGDYRIIYDIIDDILLIIIVDLGHRSNIYKDKK